MCLRSWLCSSTLDELKEKGSCCGLKLWTRVSTAFRKSEPIEGAWAWARVHRELMFTSRILSVIVRRSCSDNSSRYMRFSVYRGPRTCRPHP